MVDYQGNTNKGKEPKPEKVIEKVVTGEVIQKPKSLGRRFKTVFLGGDFRAASGYVVADVIFPAIRSVVFDSISKGAERVIFGDSVRRTRPPEYRPTVRYDNPMNRSWPPTDPRYRNPNLPDQPSARWRQTRRNSNDIIVQTRQEAELIVERLIDCIDQYQVASQADLWDLLGWETSPIQNKWGWTYLHNVEIRSTPEGFLIDLPQLEAL